jgi:hypothetical protein
MDKRLRVLRGKAWDDLASLMERRQIQAEQDLAAAQANAERAAAPTQSPPATPPAAEVSEIAPAEPSEPAPPARTTESTVARPFHPVGFAAPTPPPFPAWPPATAQPAPFAPLPGEQRVTPTNGHAAGHPESPDDAEGADGGLGGPSAG